METAPMSAPSPLQSHIAGIVRQIDELKALLGGEHTALLETSCSFSSNIEQAAGLVALAIADTDFLGDLDPATLSDNAANSADLAADISEDRDGHPVPLDVIHAVRVALVERGYLILAAREQDAIDARAAGLEAGDLDADGEPIGYPRYYGGV